MARSRRQRCAGVSRRSVLKAGIAGAGFTILADSASVRSAQANEKLAVAHVGCGGRGQELIGTFAQLGRIVAMCDVNESKAGPKYAQFPDVPKYHDFRVMLEKEAGRIDAVVVATPDHTHAVISAAAIRAGKHVYTEKPLTRTVRESRALRELAAKQKVATSMGNQGTASGPFRRAVELIRQGALGTVREVLVWNDGGGADHKEPPKEQREPPPYLKWDLWLGPAKDRPFSGRWLSWGQWRDFGTSQLGNWASHTANLAFMALKVDELWRPRAATYRPSPPLRVEAKRSGINHLSFPRWEVVTWNVPPRGEGLPAVPFRWFNGPGPGSRALIEEKLGRQLDWGDAGAKKWADFAGCLIVGDKAKLHATGHNATVTYLPAEAFPEIQKDRPEALDASQGHERDFVAACRGGKPAWASYDYAAPLNEFLQLGNLATRVEGPIDYDPVAGRIVNGPEADAMLGSEYRAGWTL